MKLSCVPSTKWSLAEYGTFQVAEFAVR